MNTSVYPEDPDFSDLSYDPYDPLPVQFAKATKNLFEKVPAYLNHLKEALFLADEQLFETWEDDVKANSFLLRLLASIARGRPSLEPGLLSEIRQFAGEATVEGIRNTLEAAKVDSKKMREVIETQIENYMRIFELAAEKSLLLIEGA
jgi:hypothetical protein